MRTHIKAETKLVILRVHLENQVSMAELAEKYHVNVNSILNWKKRLFESGAALFDGSLQQAGNNEQEEVEQLQRQMRAKDRVIAELAEENLALKKTFSGGN